MLTSFFGKSSPVNYLILGVFIVVGYLFGSISGSSLVITPYLLFVHGAFILLSVLMLLLLDFIIRKNHLTKSNTFAIFFFTCFISMLPVIFLQHNILLANAFLILALRRIMSLRSDRNSSKKILDASVWITIASLFYFWSLLFFVPLWFAIIQKPNSNYKQMLIPFTGFLAIFMMNTAYQLLMSNSFDWFFNWNKPISFDFSKYNAASVLVPATVILGFYIWTGAYRIIRLSAVSLKEKSNYLLMLYLSITSLLVALFGPQKTGAELLFVLAPVSIIAANYIEGFDTDRFMEKDMSEFWFKEIMLWLILILPFVFLFL
ncbi:DUF6427 family protein [Aequorivita sp. SDUM287046]|uniref:DUF6427 family protein n=1 Tax=Aequorivita aurantiaca TaxID=3053356 RepID=A0ABT8DEZ6_9FLAO|nr:DUF6427 family protein [Aequorivita aurantiaca]MDN3723119.1 DUF6427 family protein [Aequorivita aurantiaca]